MFSGLVTHIGEVVRLNNEIITIKSKLSPKIGASIAVNGTCLTTINTKNNEFEALLSTETRNLIALENLHGKVHLEEALGVSDRFDGHIVQGHIDGIGIIESIKKNDNGFDFFITFDKSLKPLIIPKGSICIDGISLTVNEILENSFRLTIIPHTFYNTLFHTYKPKRRVNIETDIIVRSIYHMLSIQNTDKTLQWNTINSILASY